MQTFVDVQQLVDRTEILSLDIFDTAVLRAVPRPIDVFQVVNARFIATGHSLIFSFPRARIQAEAKARTEVWHQHGRIEITLDEIYHVLKRDYFVKNDVADLLKQLEVATELALARRNPFIHTLYRRALEKGKRVIFVSDMYLPETVVTQILKDCGYQDYEHLLLSTKLGMTKAAGTLYEHLIATTGCKPGTILHIGDNMDSDVIVAQRYGLVAYYYEKCLDRALRLSDLRKEQIKALQVGTINPAKATYLGTLLVRYANPGSLYRSKFEDQELNFWYKLGYRYVGLLFLGFGKWLISKAISDKLERIYFLSRDGFIIKKVYEILIQFTPGAPPSEYLYASRRALNIPSIMELDDYTVDFLVSGTSRLCVGQFIQRLGLNPLDFEEVICSIGFSNAQQQVVTGRDYALLRALYQRIFPEIQRIALKERETLHAYLNSVAFWQTKTIGLVDIGWHGTLQRSLSRLIHSESRQIDIKGYYLATFKKAQLLVEEGHKINSYICHLGKPTKLHDIIKLCVEIFEFIHTAPHGSVIRFEWNDSGKIQPVFDINDYDPARVAKAEALQRGALDFVGDSAEIWSKLGFLELSPELAVEPLSQVLANPSHQEAIYLGDLEHAEGFGDVYVKRYIAKPPNLDQILDNPLQLLHGYLSAFWRRGYCKRLLSI